MSHRSQKARKAAGLVLMTGGFLFGLIGSLEFLESRLGQTQAAREFREPVSSSTDSSPAVPRPRPPRQGEAIGKLMLPRLGTELYVVEGDGAAELLRGPGHLSGTAMPGEDGNCIIAGHRDTHFRVLKDVRKGDPIVVETRRGEFLYRVTAIRVVSPENRQVLETSATPELSLITCFPFYYVGAAPKRFVVEARLAKLMGGHSSPASS